MQVYYVNPSSNPPFTSWTHPNLPTGTQHPEQIQTRREAQQLAAEEEVSPGGQPGERGFVTKAAGAFVGYKVLKHLLNKTNNGHQGGSNYGGNYGGSHGNGGVQWGTALTGAAAGAGGAMLLGKLFGVSKSIHEHSRLQR
jgi:hypothetical protein